MKTAKSKPEEPNPGMLPGIRTLLFLAVALLTSAQMSRRAVKNYARPSGADSTAFARTSIPEGIASSIKWVNTSDDDEDLGIAVNRAISSCRPGGCLIIIPGGTFSYYSTIVIDKPGVSLVGIGALPTHLYFDGIGTGIMIEEGADPPFIQGRLAELSIDGTNNRNENVAGVTLANTVGFVFGDGLSVWNFKEPGDVGMLWLNRAPGSCARCQSGFSERTTVEQVSLGNNETQLKLESTPGAINSFEFSRILNLHLQIMDGQTGVDVSGSGSANSAALSNSILDIDANIVDTGKPATFIVVDNGGAIFNNVCSFMTEETYGSGAIPYEVRDPQSTLAFGAGTILFQNFSGLPVVHGTFVPPSK